MNVVAVRSQRYNQGMKQTCVKCSGTVPHGRKVCDSCKPSCAHCGQVVVGKGLQRICGDCRGLVRWCSRCETVQDVDAFKYPNGSRAGYCYPCVLARNREDNKRDSSKEYHYVYHLSRKLGLEWEDARALAATDACEICGATSAEIGRRLHVDHCHAGGNVRGVLCPKCNHALGVLEADPEWLASLRAYLSRGRLTVAS